MLDISHIPSQQQSTFIFYATGNWQTWQKPRNAKFLEIFVLGGGGGGSSAGSVSGSGGGGGGSSGALRALVPAFLLPDTLYIQVGKGGVSGTTGGSSTISIIPSTTSAYVICVSGTGGGVGGTSTGVGGNGSTAQSRATATFNNLNIVADSNGVAGNTGGTAAGTSGGSQTALFSNLTSGGAGGGGLSGSMAGIGGNINAAPVILTSPVPGGQTQGAAGANGYGTLSPFCGTGGAGGAANTAGVGGAGGKGFYGCGGGGAGRGSTGGGIGGAGGDGLVIITVISW